MVVMVINYQSGWSFMAQKVTTMMFRFQFGTSFIGTQTMVYFLIFPVSDATSAQNPVGKHVFNDSIAALAANNFLKSTFYAEDSSVVDFTHFSSYKNNKVDGIFTLSIANSELTTTGLNKNNFTISVSFNQNDCFIMLFVVHRGLLSVKTNDKERQLLHCLLS